MSAVLVVSSALGLLRDLSLAGLFGATGDTDAFLVAWTIPETVTVLLMDGAMFYLLVPVFVAHLSSSGSISWVVRVTLLPMVVVLLVATALTIWRAPFLVGILAPGIDDQALAVSCFRVAGLTIFFMGLNGYLMAALRANNQFVRPALSYVAYNVGVLACMYALHSRMGVLSAAIGLAAGSLLMVLLQVRAFLRVTSLRGLSMAFNTQLLVAALGFFPVAAYTLGRQGQVFVERFVASTLDPGSISYVNFASKVAQMASLLALTAAAVAFPTLAKLASDRAAFRSRVEKEMRWLVLLIAPAIAFLCFFAEPCIRLLFERGAFGASDTAITSDVMRIYSLGLLGQVLISLGAFVCYAHRGRTWEPAGAVAAGLVVVVVLDVTLAPALGVVALAVGNASGITVSAVLLWFRIRRNVVTFAAGDLGKLIALSTSLALGAGFAAWTLDSLLPVNTAVSVALGSIVTMLMHVLLCAAAGVQESREMVRTVPATARLVVARLRGVGR